PHADRDRQPQSPLLQRPAADKAGPKPGDGGGEPHRPRPALLHAPRHGPGRRPAAPGAGGAAVGSARIALLDGRCDEVLSKAGGSRKRAGSPFASSASPFAAGSAALPRLQEKPGRQAQEDKEAEHV